VDEQHNEEQSVVVTYSTGTGWHGESKYTNAPSSMSLSSHLHLNRVQLFIDAQHALFNCYSTAGIRRLGADTGFLE